MSKSALSENILRQWEIMQTDFETGKNYWEFFTASLNRQAVSVEALNFNKNA